jgi:5,10-methylenetetrahydrofolate reductase
MKDKKKRRKKKKKGRTFFVFAGCNEERQEQVAIIFESIPEFFSTIASGATPIGSAGRAPDENEVINYASNETNYRACIGAHYRLPCQKINI